MAESQSQKSHSRTIKSDFIKEDMNFATPQDSISTHRPLNTVRQHDSNNQQGHPDFQYEFMNNENDPKDQSKITNDQRTKIRFYQESIQQKDQELFQQRTDIMHMNSSNKNLQNIANQLNQENQNLKNHIQSIQEAHEQQKDTLKYQYQNSISQHKNKINSMLNENQSLKSSLQQETSQKELALTDVKQLLQNNQYLMKNFEAVQQEIVSLKNQIRKNQAINDQLIQEKIQNQQALEMMNQQLNDLTHTNQNLEATNKSYGQRLAKFDKDLAQFEKYNQKLLEENSDSKTIIYELKNALKDNKEEFQNMANDQILQKIEFQKDIEAIKTQFETNFENQNKIQKTLIKDREQTICEMKSRLESVYNENDQLKIQIKQVDALKNVVLDRERQITRIKTQFEHVVQSKVVNQQKPDLQLELQQNYNQTQAIIKKCESLLNKY